MLHIKLLFMVTIEHFDDDSPFREAAKQAADSRSLHPLSSPLSATLTSCIRSGLTWASHAHASSLATLDHSHCRKRSIKTVSPAK